MKRALFIGRFQPFHNGHLSAVKEILAAYDECVIIVGSAQENLTERNPLTAGERIELISLVLKTEGIREKCHIVPVPDTPESGLWPARVLSYSPNADAIYTGNDYVELLFSREGLKVCRQKMIPQITSTVVREKITHGDSSWEKMVPTAAANFLAKNGLDLRIQKLNSSKASIG